MKFTNGQQKINKVKGIKRSKNMRMEYILIKQNKTKIYFEGGPSTDQ